MAKLQPMKRPLDFCMHVVSLVEIWFIIKPMVMCFLQGNWVLSLYPHTHWEMGEEWPYPVESLIFGNLKPLIGLTHGYSLICWDWFVCHFLIGMVGILDRFILWFPYSFGPGLLLEDKQSLSVGRLINCHFIYLNARNLSLIWYLFEDFIRETYPISFEYCRLKIYKNQALKC